MSSRRLNLNSSSAAPERSTRTSLSLKENGATKTFSGSRDGGVGLKRATSLTLTEAHEANRKTQKTAEESRGRRDNKRRMQGVDCDERTRPVHEKLHLDVLHRRLGEEERLASLRSPHSVEWQPSIPSKREIAILNLHGVKESVIVWTSIFFLFLATHGFTILYGFCAHIGNVPEIAAATMHDVTAAHTELGWWKVGSAGSGASVTIDDPYVADGGASGGTRALAREASHLYFLPVFLIIPSGTRCCSFS